MSDFNRERRYIVLKISDTKKFLPEEDIEKIRQVESWLSFCREQEGRGPLEGVFVESDWPEYNLIWLMIEARVAGTENPEQKRVNDLEQLIATVNWLERFKDGYPKLWNETDEENLQTFRHFIGEIK